MGKDMPQSEIRDWLVEHGIDEVEGLIPNMAGTPVGKFMPARKFRTDGMRLPESIFIATVTGEFTEDTAVPLSDPDMLLTPDADTIRIVPWAADPTACVIHDCFRRDGTPVELAPRYVLRRVLELYEKKGWRPVVAPEMEFYLVKQNPNPDMPLEPPVGRSGRQETARQMLNIDAVNEFEPLVEDIYDFCEAQDVAVDTLTHEVGASQLEINFEHGDPLSVADQIFYFKRIVREAALRHNVYATFMAKPMEGEPGSAMHLHQSVVTIDDGRNIFSNDDGSESDLLRSFIAGSQRYVPEAILMLAPYVNSYRRFARFLSAPINLQWGYDNRTVGLRVPDSSPASRRVENRIAGSDVNPYIAIAATLACGYLGMVEKLEASEPLEGSAYSLPRDMPRDQYIALDALRGSDAMRRVLGDRFVDEYCAIKEHEYVHFFHVISRWERTFLLLNV